jgi:hypothetical protein
MSLYDYEKEQKAQIDNLRVQLLARPLNLGGTSTGGGGPTGGFTGYLPQTRVSYDASEIASSGITSSGSLKDNLNHIRLRLQELENAPVESGIGGHVIKYNGTTLTGSNLNFTSGFNLTDTGDTIVFTSDVVSSGVTFPVVNLSGEARYPSEYELHQAIGYASDYTDGTTYLIKTGDYPYQDYLAVANLYRDWTIVDLNFPPPFQEGFIPVIVGEKWETIDPRNLVMGGGGVGGVDPTKFTVIPGENNTALSGITVFPKTVLGLQQAFDACGSYNDDVVILPAGYIGDTSYPTFTVKAGTTIQGQGKDATTLRGQLDLLGANTVRGLYIDGRSSSDRSWVINGNNTYQYLESINVKGESDAVDALQPVALYDCSFAYSTNCSYRAYNYSGALVTAFGSSLSAPQQISYPIGGYARGIVRVGGLAGGIEKLAKDYTNYSYWDMFGTGAFGNDSYHANDIASGILTRHLPLPTVSGMIPVANGTSWGLTTLPTGTTLTVKEVDNSPSVSASTIVFPNGTLTESEGVVTYTPTVIVGSGTGDMLGPASAVDGHLAVFDGTSGKILKDGGAIPVGGGGGGYTLIQEIVLSEDGIFTFTGIPQTYKHLKMIGSLRSTYNATSDSVKIQVGNGSLDTATNYTHMIYKAGSGTAGSLRGNPAAYVSGGIVSGGTDIAGLFSPFRTDIYFYTVADQFKNFDVQTSCIGTAYWSSTGGGTWRSNSAVDTLSVLSYGTDSVFKAGSRIALYGL